MSCYFTTYALDFDSLWPFSFSSYSLQEFHHYSFDLTTNHATPGFPTVFVPTMPHQDSATEASTVKSTFFQESVFHATNLNNLLINVEIYLHTTPNAASNPSGMTSTTRLAYGVLSGEMFDSPQWTQNNEAPGDQSNLTTKGTCRVPLFLDASLKYIGSMCVSYLIVKPFVHPLNNLHSLWLGYGTQRRLY